MSGRILRRELVDLRRQPALLVATAGVVLLVAVSALSAVPRFRTGEAWKHEAGREVREQWITQGVRHPHSAAHFGVIAFRPFEATALVEPGVSAHVGQMLTLETHTRGVPTYPPADDHSSASRHSPLSPALLALTLIPLLIIVAGSGMLSGEREDGNLSTLLASGVAPGVLVAGKAGALVVIVLMLSAVKAGVELAAIAATEAPLQWVRFVGLQGVHTLYFLTWALIVIGISARTRTSQAALAIALSVWAANSFVIPRVASSVGRLVVQEPSTEEFRAAIQHDIAFNPDGTPWVNDWSTRLIAATLDKYGVDRIEDLPVGYAGVMLKGSDAHYEQVFEKHFTRLHQLHQRQERWHHVLSVAGPMIAARSLGQAFAGTDLTHAEHFSDAAEQYRRMFVEATNDAAETQSTGTGWSLMVGRSYWESIPPFRYEGPDVWWSIRRHGLSVAVMGSWLLVALVWCVRGQRRMRVL